MLFFCHNDKTQFCQPASTWPCLGKCWTEQYIRQTQADSKQFTAYIVLYCEFWFTLQTLGQVEERDSWSISRVGSLPLHKRNYTNQKKQSNSKVFTYCSCWLNPAFKKNMWNGSLLLAQVREAPLFNMESLRTCTGYIRKCDHSSR